MNLQQELEKYMKLPYNYHIQVNKNSEGKPMFYSGYIEEFDISATAPTQKELETNLTLKKRDYILNCLNDNKEIDYPDQLENKKFNQAWQNNNQPKIKEHIQIEKNLSQNKAVGTVNLKKLLPAEQPKHIKEKSRNPITRMFNWLYDKFADERDKRDDEQ